MVFSLHFWFRDLLRELYKKYEVLLINNFLLFFLFLVSEGLLFVSFFWTSFHSLSSSTLEIWPGEGFYLPDPCELTFANTLLLSNAAISLGNAFISLEISSQFLIFFSLFSFILAWTFISLQIKEFRIMGLSINDSVYSCLFFFLTGLHFFHLLFGLLLCCLLFWSCSFSVFFFLLSHIMTLSPKIGELLLSGAQVSVSYFLVPKGFNLHVLCEPTWRCHQNPFIGALGIINLLSFASHKSRLNRSLHVFFRSCLCL